MGSEMCIRDRYCIKQRLSEKGFELSPLERPRRVVISKGNPVLYIDDDLFGFMMAEMHFIFSTSHIQEEKISKKKLKRILDFLLKH